MERGALKWLTANPFYAAGLAFMRLGKLPPDFDPAFTAIYQQTRPFTMTQREGMYALYEAVRYVSTGGIPGALVECGVWKGGSAMIMALTLAKENDCGRQIYLYDTYEGMTPPSKRDIDLLGNTAQNTIKHYDRGNGASAWCYSAIDDVRDNLKRTGYPEALLNFIKGDVEETIPQAVPGQIALLRLDTDFYQSTYHELVHLYPLLASGGVLILDDYGHWKGFRQAVDGYFAETGQKLLLNRVDYQARVAVKP